MSYKTQVYEWLQEALQKPELWTEGPNDTLVYKNLALAVPYDQPWSFGGTVFPIPPDSSLFSRFHSCLSRLRDMELEKSAKNLLSLLTQET